MRYLILSFYFSQFCFISDCKSNNIESIIRFGDSLFAYKNYKNAINEYQRAFFFAGDDLKILTGARIADCYLLKEDYFKARNYYDSAIYYSTSSNAIIEFQFQKILCLILEKNFGLAQVEMGNLKVDTNCIFQRRKDLFQGICYFGMKQYEKSYKHLDSFLLRSDTVKRIQLTHLFENVKISNRPNPNLAIMLSVVFPGTGQFYSGDFKSGANSILLLSGLYYLGTSVSISSFVIIIPFFYRYYIGGILNAKQAAEGKKEKRQLVFYNKLIEILLK